MNKKEITNKLGIRDSDQENKIKRLLDLIMRVNKEYVVLASDFISPDLTGYVSSIFFDFRDLSYMLLGGYDEAEYQKVVIYPDYMTADKVEISKYISVLEIKYNTKFGDIGHRDVLGSLMGLGIKREKIGDILLANGRAQVIVDTDISSYIEINLTKIGRINVLTEIVGLDDIIKKEYEIKDIFSTVKSVRLDAIIASGFNISRSKAVELIKMERVKVNHCFVKSVSKELHEGDLISVKGKGRIILEAVGGLSKKDRYRVEIKRFI